MPLLMLAIVAIFIAGMWRMFSKAGKPGWASIVPVYNLVVLLQIAGRPVWWLLLFFIPFVGAIFAIGGVGSILGSLASTRFIERHGLGPALLGSQILSGVARLFIPLAGGSALAVAAILFVGEFLLGAVFDRPNPHRLHTAVTEYLDRNMTPVNLNLRLCKRLFLDLFGRP